MKQNFNKLICFKDKTEVHSTEYCTEIANKRFLEVIANKKTEEYVGRIAKHTGGLSEGQTDEVRVEARLYAHANEIVNHFLSSDVVSKVMKELNVVYEHERIAVMEAHSVFWDMLNSEFKKIEDGTTEFRPTK